MITLQERRARGDHDVPMRDLPANGARSRHTLRAYGYDVMVWVRFLDEARSKTIWRADRDDMAAVHRARRRSCAHERIAASSWNRTIAALDKLYAWALEEELVKTSPFRRRPAWRLRRGGRSREVVSRKLSYESTPRRTDIALVTMPEFQRFCDVGLRGLRADGGPRPGARDRNGARNALFAELLFSTGLRLEEASSLLAFEIAPVPKRGPVRLTLPERLIKGDRGRTIIIPRTIVAELHNYIAFERALAADALKAREEWRSIDAPIFCKQSARSLVMTSAKRAERLSLDELTPDERRRIVLVDSRGRPTAPAALWLSEIGLPVAPNSWDRVFMRASQRCADAGLAITVTPHQLRHAFAVHMLAMLIRKTIAEAGSDEHDPSSAAYRRLLGDPLHAVQRLLGHSSIETTYIYLDHLAGLRELPTAQRRARLGVRLVCRRCRDDYLRRRVRVALQLRLAGGALEYVEDLDQALKPRRFLGQPLEISVLGKDHRNQSSCEIERAFDCEVLVDREPPGPMRDIHAKAGDRKDERGPQRCEHFAPRSQPATLTLAASARLNCPRDRTR